MAFRSDQGDVSPWAGVDAFWTATQHGSGMHSRFSIASGGTNILPDTGNAGVFFQVLTVLTPPDAPGGVMLTAGNTQIIVTWTSVPVADSGGGAITDTPPPPLPLARKPEPARLTTTPPPPPAPSLVSPTRLYTASSSLPLTDNTTVPPPPSKPPPLAPSPMPLAMSRSPPAINESLSLGLVDNGGAAITGYTATATTASETTQRG